MCVCVCVCAFVCLFTHNTKCTFGHKSRKHYTTEMYTVGEMLLFTHFHADPDNANDNVTMTTSMRPLGIARKKRKCPSLPTAGQTKGTVPSVGRGGGGNSEQEGKG